MYDLFISYSRRDRAFAEQLRDALRQTPHPQHPGEQLKVWMDDEIEPNALWWERILKHIRDSSSLLIILSDDYMGSQVCNEEFAYALEKNKPIITLLHRPVSPDGFHAVQDARQQERGEWQERPGSIADEHWERLQMRQFINAQNAPLERVTAEVTRAVFEDVSLKDLGTELMTRAEAWVRSQHRPEYLLTGAALRTAEAWRDQATPKGLVDESHITFLAASRARQASNQRSRVTAISGAALALLLTAALALTLFFQSQANLTLANLRGTESANNAATSIAEARRADTNAEIASENQAAAESQRLALLSVEALNAARPEPRIAALLALQALDRAYTAEADLALGRALSAQRLTAQVDEERFFWQWAAPYLTEAYAVPEVFEFDYRFYSSIRPDVDGVIGLSLSGTLTRTSAVEADTAAWDPVMELYGIDDYEASGRISLTATALSPGDPGRALLGFEDGSVRAVTLETGATLWERDYEPNPIRRIAIADGAEPTLAIVSGDRGEDRDRVLILNWNGAILQQWSVAPRALDTLFTPDGSRLLIASGSSATLYDVQTSQPGQQFLHGAEILRVAITADGSRVVTLGSDYLARVWDVASGAELYRLPIGSAASQRGAGAPVPQAAHLLFVESDTQLATQYITEYYDDELQLWRYRPEAIEIWQTTPLSSGIFQPLFSVPQTLSYLSDIGAIAVYNDFGLMDCVRVDGLGLSALSRETCADRSPQDPNSLPYRVEIVDNQRVIQVTDASGRLIRSITGQNGAVIDARAVSGLRLAAITAEGLHLWPLDLQTTRAQACARLRPFADLTDAERARYQIDREVPTCPPA